MRGRTDTEVAASPVASSRAQTWARNWWLVPAVLAAALAALFMVVMPPHRTLNSVLEVPWRLSPVLLAVVAIAGFPQRRGLAMTAVGATFIAYMGVVDTSLVLQVDDYVAAGSSAQDAFDSFYQFQLFMSAFMVLAIVLAYRLGGGGTTRTLQVGTAGVLVLISGLNDLSYWLLADWPNGRPDTLFWASHIKVFVGESPSIPVAIVFTTVHLVLAGIVLTPPVERRLDRLAARLGTR
ncbi:MAG TPA: hypothetical protein VH419_02260 [Nocardioidaceae bacterium]|jgi:hypothetical protein